MSRAQKNSLLNKGRFEKGHKPYHSFKGKHHTEEAKEKLSEGSRKNNPRYWLGKNLSEETKKKLSDSKKGQIPYMTGRHHSIESCRKMSLNHKGIQSGEKHPNWKGGISFEPYCPKFNDKLKEQIRERDDKICQLCGIKENGKKLDIHHIHYDKPNCNPDLISLCNKCHGKVNWNRDYWEEYFMNLLRNRGLLI